MLRTVRQVLHTSLLTTGVLSLCWLPASFVFDLYLGWPTSQRDAGVLVTRGCVWLWHTQGINPSIAPVEEGVSFTIQVGHSTSTKGSLVPTYERSFRQSAYGPTKSVDVRVPLWLLAAICLAWPVTSLLLARRRRKGRGFAVEPDPDAAPPVIDRPAHRPSNLPPLPRMLRRLRNLLLMTGLLSRGCGMLPGNWHPGPRIDRSRCGRARRSGARRDRGGKQQAGGKDICCRRRRQVRPS